MASRGQTITIAFVAWDTVANAGKTADSANFTLRWVKDGTSSAPTNAASEVDSTNAPGVYKLTLTATECTCNSGVLCGKSSTSGVSIMPLSVTFEQLPTAAPAATGGLPTVDANNAVTLPAKPPAGFIDEASIAAGALDGKGDWLPSSAMTESYAADGDAPTPAQALFFIQQLLSDFIISGSTLTVRKLDGSTTAFTLTLNDATNPTGATRDT